MGTRGVKKKKKKQGWKRDIGTRGGGGAKWEKKKKKAKKANSRMCEFWAWRKWGFFSSCTGGPADLRKGERDS